MEGDLPRLVLGLVAAATSLWWCSLVIDVAAGVSGFVAESLGVNPSNLLRAPLEDAAHRRRVWERGDGAASWPCST